MIYRRLKPVNKRALRKALWSSLSRVIGITLGVASASIIQKLMGERLENWHTALAMAIASFALMWFAEYERET